MKIHHSNGESTSSKCRLLTELETCIKEEFQELEESMKKSLLHAKRIGDLLNEARPHIKYGNWEAWVERNFPFTVRTARNYIAIAKSWEWISKTENFSDLLLGDALNRIRAKKAQKEGIETSDAKNQNGLLGAAPVTGLKELLSQTRQDLDHFKRISWKASAVPTRIPQIFAELEKTRKMIDDLETHIRQDFPHAGAVQKQIVPLLDQSEQVAYNTSHLVAKTLSTLCPTS